MSADFAKKNSRYAFAAVGASALISCLMPFLGLSAPASDVAYAASTLGGYALILAPALIVCAITKPARTQIGLDTKKLLPALLCGIALLAATLLFSPAVIGTLFGAARQLDFRVVWLAAIAAVFEEFLFRGYLQGALFDWFKKWKGILLCALVFAVFHLPQRMYTGGMSVQGALVSAAILFPAGIAYSLFTLPFQNIWFAVFAHFCANLLISMLP